MKVSQIKTRRVKDGLSQAELGRLVGVSGRTICNYENGTTKPSKQTLRNIQKVLTSVEKSWARTVRSLRTMMGYSQQEVAEAAGVSKSVMGHYETGYRKPSLRARRALVTVLSYGMKDLLNV